MSLIAAGTGTAETPLEELANNGFWPAVSPTEFRDVQRIDGTVTDARLLHALRVAMADVNRQLADYQLEQQAEGIATVAEIPLEPWHIEGHHAQLYRRAVYSQAHAELLERYRDVSATAEGDERGEAKDLAADDVRADARWAIAELTGRTHTTVELI
ncbi:head completion/stabilization protein [Billgrantia gudaonensis]|uniref:Phage head completion protein (GPL) n=1 Tax=Billgrantia gudaonensis TaxID=376427 RepID=A0A1G8TI14_9GAMM|nr:head completion/stabilization protein [Halomonas gudaonensis]SDJ41242.1 Phage head completion protein (GPL) [Halomonas gudaonensis]